MLQLLLCLVFLVHRAHTGCSTLYGPAGSTECVAFTSYYNQYQWATCLTSAYIQQKSHHKHICANRLATYCYYQCMIETHNKVNGPVSKDCSCTPSSKMTTAYPWLIKPTTSLPSECFSPSGASCQWYRNCLEKKYPCEATSNAYAISYAEKFCNLYNEKKLWFTTKGRQWMNGVRKCLQVALVPLIRPWKNPTCKEIRKVAFASHSPCYLNPDRGVPSVCDLEVLEFVKIFFVIKGSFTRLDTAWEALKGMWNIVNTCGGRYSQNLFKQLHSTVIKMTKIVIQKLKRRRLGRSSDPLPNADAQNRFADQVGSGIANTLKWNSEVMDWIAYPGNDAIYSSHDHLTVYMILVDKKGLGIAQTSTPSVSLNSTVYELASAIQQSQIPLQIGEFNVWLKSLASCSDKSCRETKSLAVSFKMPSFSKCAPVMDRGLKGFITASTALAIILINHL